MWCHCALMVLTVCLKITQKSIIWIFMPKIILFLSLIFQIPIWIFAPKKDTFLSYFHTMCDAATLHCCTSFCIFVKLNNAIARLMSFRYSILIWIFKIQEIVNVSCPVYNGGSQQMNLLCAVNLEKNQLLPDMKIAKEAREYLSHMSTSNQSFFLGVGFHKPHIPFHIPR